MTSSPIRSTGFIAVLLAAAAGALFGQDLVFPDGLRYNDFYAAEVQTVDGERFTLFDVAAFEGEAIPWPDAEGNFGAERNSNPGEDMKYFFWVRRIGPTGAITYPLPFRRISSIEFTNGFGGSLDNPPLTATLVVGDSEREVTVLEVGERFTGWYGDREPPVPGYTSAVLVLTDGSEQEVWIKTDGFLGGIDEEFGTYAMLWIKHDGVARLDFNHNGNFARCPECGAIFYDDRQDVCPFDGTPLESQN